MAIDRAHRIDTGEAFSAVRTRGTSYRGASMIVRVLPGGVPGVRCAVVVPVRTEPVAAKRNRIRRRVSEHLRALLRKHPHTRSATVVVTVNKNEEQTDVIRRELVMLLTKSDILQR